MDFAKKNPGTVVYIKPRRHKAAVVVAEYCKLYTFISKFTDHYGNQKCLSP